MRKLVIGAVGAVAVVACALPTVASPRPTPARFAAPVKVTPDRGHGYEPTVVTDRFGNLYATAHKENWQLAAAPDSRSTTQVRSMSWAWYSSDGGRSWRNLPGLPAGLEQHQPGVEGDMAVDNTGHLYYVDTYLGDNSLTVWKATGRDRVAFVATRPVQVTGGLDDRPWITAHGDGKVYYLGNSANKLVWDPTKVPDQSRTGSGYGAGRYAVYASRDHGKTFDSVGYPLKDSGWCRPAADQAQGSTYVYVVCGDDYGTLYSYVSKDDGRSFERYTIGSYQGQDSTESYPTVGIGRDGTLWALYVDAEELDGAKMPIRNRLVLFSSKDRGRTWKRQDVTPRPGRYQYGWLSVAPNGNLGLGVYHRRTASEPWRVYGAIWKPGQRPVLASLDEANPVAPAVVPEPPGDYLMSSFGPDNKLAVLWTRIVQRVHESPDGAPKSIVRDIYSARSR